MEILSRIEKIVKLFSQKNIQIAVAESCTGGYVSNMITNISGASAIFERGIICYSNKAKIELLDINPDSLEEHGAVSDVIVKQLANNIRIKSKVNIGIGISGIAGPTGGSPEKPVGLVYIGFSTETGITIEKYIFKTDRINFKQKVLEKVIQYLESINI